MADAYDALITRLKELSVMGEIGATLAYDQEVFMPSSATQARGDAMGWIAKEMHARSTDPSLGELITSCEADDVFDGLDTDQKANIIEARRSWERSTRLPADLVEETAKHQALAQMVWAEARAASDFSRFSGTLSTMLDLKKKAASLLSDGGDHYDALLDLYETGLTQAALDPMFAELEATLVPLLAAIQGAPAATMFRFEDHGPYPIEAQEAFGREISEALGFDFGRGRMDVSTHPFSSGLSTNDIRFTTRYDPLEPLSAFYGTLHETGHSLYEQGLDPSHVRTPRGESVSLGVHESQSRFWENTIGRSRPFWEWLWPRMIKHFPQLDGVADAEQAFRAANRVGPTFIRVEADEVTYNLHILLRYRIEQRLIAGDLSVDDLPKAWDEMMENMLGIRPTNAAEGCLQDIHWSFGAFGYFPTYTLGNLYAAHLFTTIRQDISELDDEVAAGEFTPILTWLRERVHSQGCVTTPVGIIEAASGCPPTAEAFLDSLSSKMSELHGLTA